MSARELARHKRNFYPKAGLPPRLPTWHGSRRHTMHGIIYIVGLVVIILAVLSFFGLR